MAADVTNTLVATITSTEQSSSAVDINRSTGNPAISATTGTFNTYVACLGGANVLTLPVDPVYQCYIKNLDATKTITVAWTPNEGVGATILLLNPGDQIMFWCSIIAGAGVTGITLTPSAAGALVEYFLGG